MLSFCYFSFELQNLEDPSFARTNTESLAGLTPNQFFILIRSGWQSCSCCIIKSIPGRMSNVRKWRLLCHVGNCSSTLVVILALSLTPESPAEQRYSHGIRIRYSLKLQRLRVLRDQLSNLNKVAFLYICFITCTIARHTSYSLLAGSSFDKPGRVCFSSVLQWENGYLSKGQSSSNRSLASGSGWIQTWTAGNSAEIYGTIVRKKGG